MDYVNTKIRTKSVRAFKVLKLDTIQYTDLRKKKNEQVADADPESNDMTTFGDELWIKYKINKKQQHNGQPHQQNYLVYLSYDYHPNCR